jgi:hypothetical protein
MAIGRLIILFIDGGRLIILFIKNAVDIYCEDVSDTQSPLHTTLRTQATDAPPPTHGSAG